MPEDVGTENNEGAGTRIGRYTVVRLISDRGQEGPVYEARCVEAGAGVRTGEIVAIKVLRHLADNAGRVHRTQKRVDLLSRNPHPNIVRYYEFLIVPREDEDGEDHCLVMEFLKGHTLDHWIKQYRSGMPWVDVHRIFQGCFEGLQHARQMGLVHRDLKASNIFVLEDGSAKLIDFDTALQRGVTTATAEADEDLPTRTDDSATSAGAMRGTPAYMAPEFHPKHLPTPEFCGDEQSDIFSLAVCFYESITGRLPYTDKLSNDLHGFLARWQELRAFQPDFQHDIFWVLVKSRAFVTQGLATVRAERFSGVPEAYQAFKGITPRVIANGDQKYTFIELVGSGGFGKVYKAVQQPNGPTVAIKCLRNAKFADRFIREARLQHELNHPNLVRSYGFFQQTVGVNDRYYLVMEFLDGMPGCSLRDRIRQGPLSVIEAVGLFIRYADALAAMHTFKKNGVIHRDIKPANLYAPPDDVNRAKVLDLGIARDLSGTVSVGPVPGTFDYMAPEFGQSGEDRGTPQTDLYSLGLCLYETLAGKPAMERLPRNASDVIRAFIERCQKPPPVDWSLDVFTQWKPLRELVARAIAFDPKARFQTAAEMRDALSAFERALRPPATATVEELIREAAQTQAGVPEAADSDPRSTQILERVAMPAAPPAAEESATVSTASLQTSLDAAAAKPVPGPEPKSVAAPAPVAKPAPSKPEPTPAPAPKPAPQPAPKPRPPRTPLPKAAIYAIAAGVAAVGIGGLVLWHPWDTRTPEQRQADAEKRAVAKQQAEATRQAVEAQRQAAAKAEADAKRQAEEKRLAEQHAAAEAKRMADAKLLADDIVSHRAALDPLDADARQGAITMNVLVALRDLDDWYLRVRKNADVAGKNPDLAALKARQDTVIETARAALAAQIRQSDPVRLSALRPLVVSPAAVSLFGARQKELQAQVDGGLHQALLADVQSQRASLQQVEADLKAGQTTTNQLLRLASVRAWQAARLVEYPQEPELAKLRAEADRQADALATALDAAIRQRSPTDTREKRIAAARALMTSPVAATVLASRWDALSKAFMTEEAIYLVEVRNDLPHALTVAVGEAVGEAVEARASHVFTVAVDPAAAPRNVLVQATPPAGYRVASARRQFAARPGGACVISWDAGDASALPVALAFDAADAAIRADTAIRLRARGTAAWSAVQGLATNVQPGAYELAFERPDYEPVVRELEAAVGEGRHAVPVPAAAEWKPTENLSRFTELEQAAQKNAHDDIGRLSGSIRASGGMAAPARKQRVDELAAQYAAYKSASGALAAKREALAAVPAAAPAADSLRALADCRRAAAGLPAADRDALLAPLAEAVRQALRHRLQDMGADRQARIADVRSALGTADARAALDPAVVSELGTEAGNAAAVFACAVGNRWDRPVRVSVTGQTLSLPPGAATTLAVRVQSPGSLAVQFTADAAGYVPQTLTVAAQGGGYGAATLTRLDLQPARVSVAKSDDVTADYTDASQAWRAIPAQLPPGAYTVRWQRADYQPVTAPFTIAVAQDAVTLRAPDAGWQPSATLAGLLAAKRACADGDLAKAMESLPRDVSGLGPANARECQALQDRLADEVWQVGDPTAQPPLFRYRAASSDALRKTVADRLGLRGAAHMKFDGYTFRPTIQAMAKVQADLNAYDAALALFCQLRGWEDVSRKAAQADGRKTADALSLIAKQVALHAEVNRIVEAAKLQDGRELQAAVGAWGDQAAARECLAYARRFCGVKGGTADERTPLGDQIGKLVDSYAEFDCSTLRGLIQERAQRDVGDIQKFSKEQHARWSAASK